VRRLEQLLVWAESSPLPRWRLIEAWTVAAHGPYMAVAGGFRLAFWSVFLAGFAGRPGRVKMVEDWGVVR
jgi:hypothetical protein